MEEARLARLGTGCGRFHTRVVRRWRGDHHQSSSEKPLEDAGSGAWRLGCLLLLFDLNRLGLTLLALIRPEVAIGFEDGVAGADAISPENGVDERRKGRRPSAQPL